MKKSLKILSVIISVMMVLTCIPLSYAADAYVHRNFSAGASQADIQEALDEARDNATDARPYMISLGDGEYHIDGALNIYSNTYFKMSDGATIIKNKKEKLNAGDNMLKLGVPGDDPASGYYYKNVTVEGGVWNENYMGNPAIKMAHGTNITFRNTTIRNITDAHLLELAAIDGITIENCHFLNQVSQLGENEDANEAIQFDVLHLEHIRGYEHMVDEVDYLMKNISVTGCTFDNVNRAMGSHTAVNGKYMQNVTLKNNTLTNIRTNGIICYNMQNLEISGNRISSKGNGIELDAMTENANGYLNSRVPGFVPSIKPTVAEIHDNTITATGATNSHGIYIRGSKLTKATKNVEGDTMPAGDYYISDVKIYNNTVSTTGADCVPILTANSKNIQINGNTVTKSANSAIWAMETSGTYITGNTIKASGNHAIAVNKGSSFNDINGNEITGANASGIYISDSAVKHIVSNKVNSPKNHAIVLSNVTGGAAVNSNTVASPAGTGFFLRDSAVKEVIGNSVTKATGGHGILLDGCTGVSAVTNNTVNTVTDTGIYVKNTTGGASVSNNSITAAGANGVVLSGSTIGNIDANTVSGAKANGIYGLDSKIANITNNQVPNAVSHGIVLTNCTGVDKVSDNTITAPKGTGIYGSKSTVNSIASNVVTGAGAHGIFIGESPKVTEISYNKITSPKSTGIYLRDTASDNILKNEISNSGSHALVVDGCNPIKAINGNIIASPVGVGVYVKDSKTTNVVYNSVSNASNHAILITGKASTATLVNVNKITAPKGIGIYINGIGSLGNINYNTISKPKTDGIFVFNSKGLRIGQNTVTSAGDSGIKLKQATASKIDLNKLSLPVNSGVFCYDKSVVTEISSNTVTGSKNAIRINASTAKSVISNTITSPSNYGILFEGASVSGKVAGNKISKAKSYAVRIAKGGNIRLYNNTFSGNKVNGYSVAGSKNYTIANLAYVKSSAKKNGKVLRVTWNKNTAATGFYIYRSTAAKTGFANIGKVSSKYNYYNDSKAVAKRYYYYRVMAYRSIPGSKVIQYSSYNTSAKAKR